MYNYHTMHIHAQTDTQTHTLHNTLHIHTHTDSKLQHSRATNYVVEHCVEISNSYLLLNESCNLLSIYIELGKHGRCLFTNPHTYTHYIYTYNTLLFQWSPQLVITLKMITNAQQYHIR